MQDGAPCHTSQSTKSFLDSNHICLMTDWPPQFLDINIIENLWALLKRRVAKYSPKTSDDLWNIIKEEWYAIDNDTISKLYASIPQHLKEIIVKNRLQSSY